MKIRVLTVSSNQNFNAGPKAPRDIINILKKYYDVNPVYLIQSTNTLKKIMYRLKMLKNVFFSRIKKEVLVLQFPMYENSKLLNKFFMFVLKNANKEKSIIVIHDLEGLRENNDNILAQEIARLNMVKYVIVHNDIMKKYLQEKGVKSKIYTLEIFDYLCENEESKRNIDDKNKQIVYAGNLLEAKSPFLYQIKDEKIDFTLNLYGVGLKDEKNCKNIKYMGKFPPDELPNKIEGNIGLIWDGNMDESDEHIGMKRYTKYNNPHKLSCYMATGIPVIVWKKSAIAKFVSENNIGYTISSIYDINNIKLDEYNKKLKNVENIKNNIRNGYYTHKVFNDIIKDMKGEK